MVELKLSGTEPFGVGGRRECYVHPLDASKCVKVLRTDERRTVRVKKSRVVPAWMRREYNNNEHERRILVSLENRIGKQMQKHIPLCYGYEPTDKGPGLVLDLVFDHDRQISRSLRELFTLGHKPAEFREAFDEFASFLLQHFVVTRNILDHNVVASLSEDGSWRISMIDGFGDPAWVPLAAWFKSYGRRKIHRRVRDAWGRYEQFYETGGVTDEMRNNSTWDQGMLRHR